MYAFARFASVNKNKKINLNREKFFGFRNIFNLVTNNKIKQEAVLLKFKSGDLVPQTGFYREVNNLGKTIRVIFANKGERFPPTESLNRFVFD